MQGHGKEGLETGCWRQAAPLTLAIQATQGSCPAGAGPSDWQ